MTSPIDIVIASEYEPMAVIEPGYHTHTRAHYMCRARSNAYIRASLISYSQYTKKLIINKLYPRAWSSQGTKVISCSSCDTFSDSRNMGNSQDSQNMGNSQNPLMYISWAMRMHKCAGVSTLIINP